MEQHQHSLGVSTLSLFEEGRLDNYICVRGFCTRGRVHP